MTTAASTFELTWSSAGVKNENTVVMEVSAKVENTMPAANCIKNLQPTEIMSRNILMLMMTCPRMKIKKPVIVELLDFFTNVEIKNVSETCCCIRDEIEKKHVCKQNRTIDSAKNSNKKK